MGNPRYRGAVRAAAALVLVTALSSCGEDGPATVGLRSKAPPAVAGAPGAPGSPPAPRDDIVVEREPGPAGAAAERIAAEIEQQFELVEVWRADARRGRVVIYGVRFRLDERSDHPELEQWSAHVRRAARDQRQAAVTMLKQTVASLPQIRLVSVYQDQFLQPFWSRRQIRAMDDPPRYRSFQAWQDLVLSAAILPGRPGVIQPAATAAERRPAAAPVGEPAEGSLPSPR